MRQRFLFTVILVLMTAVPAEAAGRAKGRGFGMRPPPGFQRAPESQAGGLQDRMGSMVQGAALSVLGEPERFVYTGRTDDVRGEALVVLNWRTPNTLVGTLDATVLHQALRDVLGDEDALSPRPITIGDSIHGLRLFLPPFGMGDTEDANPQTIVLAQMPGRLLALGYEGPGAGQRTPATWWRPVLDSITFEAAEEEGMPTWMLGAIGGTGLLLLIAVVLFLRKRGSRVPGEAAAILLQRSTMPPAPEPVSAASLSRDRRRPTQESEPVLPPEPVAEAAPEAQASAPAPVSVDEQPAGMPGVDPELLAAGGFKVVKGRPPKGVNAQHDIPSSDGIPSADGAIETPAEPPRADEPKQAQPQRSKRSGKKRSSKKKAKRQQPNPSADASASKKDGGGPKIVRNVDFVS